MQWPFDLSDLPLGSAVVGGALRDALLGKLQEKFDLDLVVPDHAIDLVKNLAQKYCGTCVVLDPDRDIARLVLDRWNIDFARQNRLSLEEDLLSRDYCLNAIALTIGSDSKIVDPTGGLLDLLEKRLVAIKEQNLIDDPVRLIRGFRLIAEHQLIINSKTIFWIKKNAHLLQRAAPERIQNELNRFVIAPEADHAINLLKTSQILIPWQNNSDVLSRNLPSFHDAKKLFNNIELSIALPIIRLTHLLSQEGLKNLRFSKSYLQKCKLLRKWQERNDGCAFKTLNEKDILQLHLDLEEFLPALILDLQPVDQKIWLEKWRNFDDPLFHPASPVDGNSLKATLDLPSGPKLGRLLGYLCHERAFGRVMNSQEAFEAASYWWIHN